MLILAKLTLFSGTLKGSGQPKESINQVLSTMLSTHAAIITDTHMSSSIQQFQKTQKILLQLQDNAITCKCFHNADQICQIWKKGCLL